MFILKQAKSVTIVQIKRRRCEVATLTRTGKWRRYGRCGMNSPSEKPSIRQWRGLGRSRGLRRGSLRRVSDARRPWLMGQWRLEGCEGHVRSALLIGAKMPIEEGVNNDIGFGSQDHALCFIPRPSPVVHRTRKHNARRPHHRPRSQRPVASHPLIRILVRARALRVPRDSQQDDNNRDLINSTALLADGHWCHTIHTHLYEAPDQAPVEADERASLARAVPAIAKELAGTRV